MLKAVIFDIDNTLYSYDKVNVPALAALKDYAVNTLGVDEAEFKEVYSKVFKEMNEYIGSRAASHNRIIRYKTILEELNLPLEPHALTMYELYWNTVLDKAERYEGVIEALKYIKDKGLKIGIGTNMTARMQFLKLEKLEVLPFVNFFVCSEEVGEEKPSPRFFARCIERAKFEAEEILFVGDTLEHDIAPALKAGMQALWFCPEKEPQGEYSYFKSFNEFPKLIDEILQRKS